MSKVTSEDVSNDGRLMLLKRNPSKEGVYPLSQLHVVLRKLTALTHLRVFECRQGLPISLHNLQAGRIYIDFEGSMFPSGSEHRLQSYELYVKPDRRILPLSTLSARSLKSLRLSGDCELPATGSQAFPSLQCLVIHSVTGNYFDRHRMDQAFPDSALRSFSYTMNSKNGFEIRDHHLQSLSSISTHSLRKLVLLSCSRLSSTCLAACFSSLPHLDYLAVSIITVDELRTNFVLALPHSISTFKLKVTNARFTKPFLAEEEGLCHAVESHLFPHELPCRYVAMDFRQELMDRRRIQWRESALQAHVTLFLGDWTSQDIV